MLVLRAIPLKKQERGGKISVTPSDKIGISSTGPWPKTGIFFNPLGPPDSFVKFYPLRQFFPTIFPTIFLSILPPRTAIFTHFTPSDSLFWQFYHTENVAPSDTFSWDPPRTKMCSFPPPHQVKNKDFQYPPGQGDLTPSDKKAISSPLLFF